MTLCGGYRTVLYCVVLQDDSDLYQNLLKELVEAGMSDQQQAGGGGGGSTSAEWMAAAQQRHKTKLHRKVDRKASKGRKTVTPNPNNTTTQP